MSLLDRVRDALKRPSNPSPGDVLQQAQRRQSAERAVGIITDADDAQEVARSEKRTALRQLAETGHNLRQTVEEALQRMEDRRRA